MFVSKSNFGLIINRQTALEWSCTLKEKSMQFVLLTCEFIIWEMCGMMETIHLYVLYKTRCARYWNCTYRAREEEIMFGEHTIYEHFMLLESSRRKLTIRKKDRTRIFPNRSLFQLLRYLFFFIRLIQFHYYLCKARFCRLFFELSNKRIKR